MRITAYLSVHLPPFLLPDTCRTTDPDGAAKLSSIPSSMLAGDKVNEEGWGVQCKNGKYLSSHVTLIGKIRGDDDEHRARR